MNMNKHRGFTIIEVLVALMVLSIGLLGVSKLILFSARSNDSAYLRSQATALAYSILDHMHANRTTALNNGYVTGSAAATANPGVNCNMAAPCTNGTTLAQFDLYQWGQHLLQALGPSGNGTVVLATVTDPVSGVSSTTATITVTWDDTVAKKTFGEAAGNGTVVLETIL